MPATLLGFLLLGLLVLGVIVVALACALLGAAFLLYAVAPAFGGATLTAATTAGLAAAALLAVGLLLCFVGLFAFSFPAVTALLRLLRILLRVGMQLAPTPQQLGEALTRVADVLEAAGGFLRTAVGPGLRYLGGKMEPANMPLPTIPTISGQGQSVPLWIKRNREGKVTEGYFENPFGFPEVYVLTSFQINEGGDLLAGTKNLMRDAAYEVEGAGTNATTIGTDMQTAAGDLRSIADIILQAATP